MPHICDFCSETAVTWRYPARTFVAYVVADIGGESVGDWAACECCHLLIESGNPQALAQRAAEKLVGKHPEMKPVEADVLPAMTTLHQSFFAHRLGAALPVKGDRAWMEES
jgi:hypothetical protein